MENAGAGVCLGRGKSWREQELDNNNANSGGGETHRGRLRNSSKLKYLLRLVNLGSRVTAGGMQVAGTLETGAYLITRNVVQSILVLLLDVVGVRVPTTQDPVALVLYMSLLALMGHGSYVTILQWRK